MMKDWAGKTATDVSGRGVNPWAIATAVAFVVYALTTAPDLSWAGAATDGGELITASYTLGVAHPPGYPTYILLGKLFSLLPVGSVAFRYNLFSALCAAAAAGLLAAAITHTWRPSVRPVVAVAAALAFAFLPLVWSQAVVAEVYSLNLLMVSAFLLAWSRRGASVWSGVWLGLSITTHLTSLFILPAALLGAGRGRWRVILGLAVGLLPLLALPWLAGAGSPVVWGGPDTLNGWWWLVTGQLYSANLLLPDAGQVSRLLHALAFGPLAIFASRVWRRPKLESRGSEAGSFQTVLWAGTIGLYGVFALFYATPDAAVLLLPGLLLLVLLLAPVLKRLGAWSLLLPLALLLAGYPARAATGNSPRALAAAVFEAAPANAILLTPGDRTLFALWYFHHVEGRRPDLVVVDANLFAFDWYRARLAAQNPDIWVPAADDLVALERSNSSKRPFCAVTLAGARLALPSGDPGRYVRARPDILCIEGKS